MNNKYRENFLKEWCSSHSTLAKGIFAILGNVVDYWLSVW